MPTTTSFEGLGAVTCASTGATGATAAVAASAAARAVPTLRWMSLKLFILLGSQGDDGDIVAAHDAHAWTGVGIDGFHRDSAALVARHLAAHGEGATRV